MYYISLFQIKLNLIAMHEYFGVMFANGTYAIIPELWLSTDSLGNKQALWPNKGNPELLTRGQSSVGKQWKTYGVSHVVVKKSKFSIKNYLYS
jgi:hypothetical protein